MRADDSEGEDEPWSRTRTWTAARGSRSNTGSRRPLRPINSGSWRTARARLSAPPSLAGDSFRHLSFARQAVRPFPQPWSSGSRRGRMGYAAGDAGSLSAPTRRSPMPKFRYLLVLVLGLTIALSVSGAATGVVHTYFGPSGYAQWAVDYSSGFNYPQYNRVYRPVPNEFWLWYSDGTYAYQFEANT